MPEIGGKKLAGDFKGLLADIRKAAAETKEQLAAAASELVVEIKSGQQVIQAIRAETAEVRATFAEVLGNAPPADEKKADPPKAEGA